MNTETHTRTNTATFNEGEPNIVAEPYSEATDGVHYVPPASAARAAGSATRTADRRGELAEAKGAVENQSASSGSPSNSFQLDSSQRARFNRSSSGMSTSHPLPYHGASSCEPAPDDPVMLAPRLSRNEQDHAEHTDGVLSPVDDALLGTQTFANGMMDTSGCTSHGENSTGHPASSGHGAGNSVNQAVMERTAPCHVRNPTMPFIMKGVPAPAHEGFIGGLPSNSGSWQPRGPAKPIMQAQGVEYVEADVLSLGDDDDDDDDGANGRGPLEDNFFRYDESRLKEFGYQSDDSDAGDGGRPLHASSSSGIAGDGFGDLRSQTSYDRFSSSQLSSHVPHVYAGTSPGSQSHLFHAPPLNPSSGSRSLRSPAASSGVNHLYTPQSIGKGPGRSVADDAYSFTQTTASQQLGLTGTAGTLSPNTTLRTLRDVSALYFTSGGDQASTAAGDAVQSNQHEFLQLIAARATVGQQREHETSTSSPTAPGAAAAAAAAMMVASGGNCGDGTGSLSRTTVVDPFSLSNPNVMRASATSPAAESVNRSEDADDEEGEDGYLSQLSSARQHSSYLADGSNVNRHHPPTGVAAAAAAPCNPTGRGVYTDSSTSFLLSAAQLSGQSTTRVASPQADGGMARYAQTSSSSNNANTFNTTVGSNETASSLSPRGTLAAGGGGVEIVDMERLRGLSRGSFASSTVSSHSPSHQTQTAAVAAAAAGSPLAAPSVVPPLSGFRPLPSFSARSPDRQRGGGHVNPTPSTRTQRPHNASHTAPMSGPQPLGGTTHMSSQTGFPNGSTDHPMHGGGHANSTSTSFRSGVTPRSTTSSAPVNLFGVTHHPSFGGGGVVASTAHTAAVTAAGMPAAAGVVFTPQNNTSLPASSISVSIGSRGSPAMANVASSNANTGSVMYPYIPVSVSPRSPQPPPAFHTLTPLQPQQLQQPLVFSTGQTPLTAAGTPSYSTSQSVSPQQVFSPLFTLHTNGNLSPMQSGGMNSTAAAPINSTNISFSASGYSPFVHGTNPAATTAYMAQTPQAVIEESVAAVAASLEAMAAARGATPSMGSTASTTFGAIAGGSASLRNSTASLPVMQYAVPSSPSMFHPSTAGTFVSNSSGPSSPSQYAGAHSDPHSSTMVPQVTHLKSVPKGLVRLRASQRRALAEVSTPSPLLLVGLASSLDIARKRTNVHGSLAGVVDYYAYDTQAAAPAGFAGADSVNAVTAAPTTIILPPFFAANNAGIDLGAPNVFPFLFTPNANQHLIAAERDEVKEKEQSHDEGKAAAAAAADMHHVDLSECTVYPIFIQMFPCELRERAAEVLNRVMDVATAVHALEEEVPASLRESAAFNAAVDGKHASSKPGTLHHLVRGRVMLIEPRSETSFIALVATNNIRRLIFILRCRLLLDRHGFFYVKQFANYLKIKEYCETVRRLPQQARHFQTDGLPCMPLVVELARSFQPSAATTAAITLATANHCKEKQARGHAEEGPLAGTSSINGGGNFSTTSLNTPPHTSAGHGAPGAPHQHHLQQQAYIQTPKLASAASVLDSEDPLVPKCFDELAPMAAVDRHRSRNSHTGSMNHHNTTHNSSSGLYSGHTSHPTTPATGSVLHSASGLSLRSHH